MAGMRKAFALLLLLACSVGAKAQEIVFRPVAGARRELEGE
jgi:hypothetical protein